MNDLLIFAKQNGYELVSQESEHVRLFKEGRIFEVRPTKDEGFLVGEWETSPYGNRVTLLLTSVEDTYKTFS